MHKNNINSKARAYVRVSTLKDAQKDSPEHQEGLIRERALSDNMDIDQVYTDKGTATNIIEREDVQQMVEDAKQRKFNTIYFASLSRFSRDTLDAISLKRILVNALGVRVISIEDMYDSGKEDNEMVFTMISSVNQQQSENTSKSSKRGIRQSAKKGNFTGSVPPYGYKKVVVDGRKTLEVVPEEAAVVRDLYDRYVNQGMGEKSLTVYLNDLGIPSSKGGVWGLSSVQRILQNENYTGFLVYGKMESIKVYEDVNDLQNRRKKLVQRDKGAWEKTEFQTHEAIVSKELFDEAQRIRLIRGGGSRGGRRSYVNVFAKFIFCKHCGSAMVTMASGRERKSGDMTYYRYLMCSKRRRQGVNGCDNSSWVPYYELRDGLIQQIIERLSRVGEGIEGLDKAAEKQLIIQAKDFEKDITKLEKQISNNRRLLFEIRRQSMNDEIDTEQYEFEKSQYEKEIKDSELKLMGLNKRSEELKNKERVLKEVGKSVNALKSITNLDDVELVRGPLSKLIQRIEFDKDGEIDIHSFLGRF